MKTVGIRVLKQQASKLVRLVREEGETIDVTYHGEVVARLVPVSRPAPAAAELEALWADLDQLTAEINATWPAGVSAVEAVSDGRRDP